MPRKRKSDEIEAKATISKKQKNAEQDTGSEKERIEKLYGISFAKDFFAFWKLCVELKPENPLNSLLCIGLKLVGPFYFLHHQNKQDDSKPPEFYHMKWRHYYDTPELLTVVTSVVNKGFHIGYFKDDPTDKENVVVANSGKGGVYSVLGDNLFAAVNSQIESYLKKANKDEVKVAKSIQTKLKQLTQHGDFSLIPRSDKVRQREKKIVAKTLQKVGIVVPISGEDKVGYRPLPHSNPDLVKLLKKITEAKDDEERMLRFDPIQEMVTFIQFANDECDYGMGLELGVDVFCNGSRYFNKLATNLLTMAYKLTKRDLYSKIIEAHLKDRRLENMDRM
ncbi:histone PARylation factor 1 [Ciona intestinalis]